MRIEYYKTYNQIHTWTGILSGLLLYICFVTGALTMLKVPLNQWALQESASLPAIAEQDYDRLIQEVLTNYPESHHELTVNLPGSWPQSAPVTWIVEDHDTHAATVWQASFDASGDLIAEPASVSAIGEFFDHLHRTAGIPGGSGHDAIGTYVMGVVAALYFIAMVSGLIIFLPTWFKDFLTLRRGKNRKRFWLDFHNILGISALPFHIVIAITTVAFAYHDIFYDTLGNWVYKDTPMFDRPAATAEARPLSDLASIAQLEQGIRDREPAFDLAQLRYSNLDTPRAMVIFGGNMDGQWSRAANYTYAVGDPYSGQPGYTAMLPSQPSVLGKIVNGFFALHFGGFGGDTVRWIYVGLGITGALLFLTGNILWLETRRKKQKAGGEPVTQKRSSRIMARLTTGVATGTLAGVVLSLLAVKWLPHAQLDISVWQQWAYYFGFLACIVWAFLQPPLKAAKQQLILVCIGLVSLVLSTFLRANDYTPELVNGSFALISILAMFGLIATLRRLTRSGPTPADSVWS